MEENLDIFLDSKDAIYHFTTKEKALEYILNDKQLKLGTFSKTNDPQEYKAKLISAVGESIENEKEKVEVTTQVNNIIKGSGFLSFCENTYQGDYVKQHGYKKARMWSHYSSNHSGICLVFSKSMLIKRLNSVYDSISTVYSNSIRYYDHVSHTKANPLLVINEEDINKKNPRDIALNYISTNYKKVLFQKQIDYEGESEFRIIVVPKNEQRISGSLFDISSCLKVVILGDSFHNVYIPSVDVLSKNLNVTYKKLLWENNQFFLHSYT